MALQKYVKSKHINSSSQDELKIHKEKPVNIWSIGVEGYEQLQNVSRSSKLTNFLIPLIFIFSGFFLIWQYAHGEIVTVLQEINGNLTQGNSTIVDYDYIDLSNYISNPEGLDIVAREAFREDVLLEDPVSNEYNGVFYITIPALGINRLPVQANVDSTTETSYSSVLERSLAHFENTGLPISDVQNNIVIYGHSASAGYNPSPADPVVAFSFLRNLTVGDEIIIEIEGETHTFKMYKSKVVEPTDFSIINGETNRRQLTLFTCDPPGNNSHRLAVMARPV